MDMNITINTALCQALFLMLLNIANLNAFTIIASFVVARVVVVMLPNIISIIE